MPSHWAFDAVFYHIYPLGLCGAPPRSDFSASPQHRLEQLHGWIPHLLDLGVNAVYLGPLFLSTAHGYDTADYYWVDRRLGDGDSLARLVQALHAAGLRVILDGVFNHVGRDFWAFRDLQANGPSSAYTDWFVGVDFTRRSPYGDPFAYEGWNGHYDLVKLNLQHPDVRSHLLGAVRQWIEAYAIDGLRLDVADCLDLDFQQELARFTRSLRPDFWLMGEVIHGDYRRWANPGVLDSVTNYECYKGLYSSLNERNYFEIAYALERQFGPRGLYRGLPLYNFVDNHDVDRAASRLAEPRLLYPLYALLFTMPGVPSIYYGSEWGLPGRRSTHSDAALRPPLDLSAAQASAPQPDLPGVIRRLADVRRASPALRRGDYQQLHVAGEQLAFLRRCREQAAVVLLNAAAQPVTLDLRLDLPDGLPLFDLLNDGQCFTVSAGRLAVPLYPNWARVLCTTPLDG